MSDTNNLLIRELYFLIFKFLEKSPCSETIRVLREELEQNSLLPPQYNWTTGAECSTTVDQVKSQYSHVTADYLLRMLKQSSDAVSQLNPPPVNGIVSFLSSGRFSLLRSIIKKDPLVIDQDESLPRSSYLISNLANHINHAPIIPSTRFYRHHPGNFVSSLISREISGPKPIAHLLPSKFYERYTKYRRLLGHLSSVYCVLFDRTGQYIFTGADDSLVKIWSAADGRLLMTLRGHINEITDLSVNYENTMLAAGSCDKMIRVWCLKTTAPITILNAHNALITSVKFCPLMKDDNRFLVSTSNDGCICFWEYNAQTNVFKERPIKFTERRRPGAQIVCSSFSVGGVFLAVGSSDNYLRVYHVSAPAGPTKILEIEQHSDHVDSIQFSNHSTRFVSGSRDGVAHIWYFEKQNWRNIALRMTERLPGMAAPPEENRKVRVSMVGWTCDDAHVITSLSDNSIKVWESKTGKLKHVLYGHEEEVFVLEPHPKDGRIFLSGGHDGAIIIWDLITGTTIQTFFNAIDGQGHGAVFDCKFSPDGNMFASTDSHGHLTLFGLPHSDAYSLMPDHVFFHTDYRPVIRDANHYAIDEQTQIAPHLMPPPFLVDIDGNPYSPAIQRLVPGRENCAESQLIPYVADASLMGEGGNAEAEAAQQRQTIDDLIQQLARNVDQSVQQPNANNAASIPASNQQQQQEARNAARDPNRRNGDVEGVRQPANFLSRGNAMRPIWYKKPIVPSLSNSELACNRDRQIDFAKSEEEYYNSERRKRQDAQDLITIKIESQKPRFTRSKQRIIQQRRGVRLTPYIRPRGATGGGINDFENPDEVVTDDDNDKDFTGLESSSEESDESDDSDWNTPTTSAGGSRPKRKRNAAARSSDEDAAPAVPTEEEEARKAIRREKLNEIKMIRRRRYEQQYNAIRELPEAFKPSEWLADTKPKRTPYFPQIGDEIVYFRSGHQHYLDHIRSNAVYSVSSSVKPYKLRGCDSDEIFAKIVNVRYDVKPPRLVSLKLVVLDPELEDPLTNNQFTVRYHDVENVVDFIILKRLYDQSIAQDWKQGDEFRSVIDDKWWFGRIDTMRDVDPFSYFQCCEVTWANGDQEFLSPWDMESIVEEVLPENRTEGIPVTDEERVQFNLINENEWPSSAREEERQRLLNGLIRIMEFSHSEDFIVPVDLGVHPIYGMIIPYPMDLSTVKARIENNFYRRVEAIKFDINFIETNAEQYNVPESEIVKKAKIVTTVCRRFIDDDQCFDPLPIYLDVIAHAEEANSNASTSSSLSSNATVESERPLRKSARRARVIVSDSDNENNQHHSNRPTRNRQPTSNANSDYLYPGTSRRSAPRRAPNNEIQIKSWKQNCRELLEYLFDLQDSEPFRAPVDPIQYPNYSHVIDTPMDLTTVKEQLLADIYDSPNDFCKDMRLVFFNSKTFNTNKKSRIYSMTVRLSSLFEEKMRNIMSNWKSTNKLLKRGGTVSSRRRPLPLSPVRVDDRNSRSNKQSRGHAASPPLEHPSTSSGYSNSRNQRPSQRKSAIGHHYGQSSNSSHDDSYRQNSTKRSHSSDDSPVEKYGLRRRNKKARKVYKEESDEEVFNLRQHHANDDDTGHSTRSRSSGLYQLRKKRKNSGDFYDEEQVDKLLDEYENEQLPIDEGDETEEDESEENNEDSEETKDEEDDDEEEEADEGHPNDGGDSDATQIEEDDDEQDMDKENSNGKRRPTRAAARKRVNYDENDGEESDTEVIREKSVNVRRNGSRHLHSSSSNRFSFAQINESSRSSMSSSNHNAYNSDGGDDGSRPLRRSRRKVRRTRRFSSDEEPSSRTAGSNSNDYDGSDLYSAVKTRHRNASTGRHAAHHRNYNEDDNVDEDDDDGDEVYSPNSNYRRRGVFSNGRTTLMSRS